MKKFYITTAIPYVNAAPHIGFALELILTDIIARYHRLRDEDVFFLTGTDENALKNVVAAREAGKEVREFVDDNAKEFKGLKEILNLSWDDFIRTTEDRHIDGAQKLWSSCREEDIYKKKYKGLYCVGCEEFKIPRELVDECCPEHPNAKLEEVEEENYFFRLSAYQDEIRELIKSNKLKITPEIRRNEVMAFIEGGLEDFSISRSRQRAQDWGVGVPGDDSQVMYVWFDALSNYINALGYVNEGEQFSKYWQKNEDIVHVIGKGVTRFHAIYWPAMLMSAGIKPPSQIFVHGYVTIDGKKISKSLGNVIEPNEVVQEYDTDTIRYFIAREMHPFEDSDFSWDRFKETYNANLANGLGNLVSRIMKMYVSYEVEDVPKVHNKDLPDEYVKAFENFEINKAADFVWNKIGNMDRFIQEAEPFKKIKTDPEGAKKDVARLVIDLWRVARLLDPFLPETSLKIQELIEQKKTPDQPLFARK